MLHRQCPPFSKLGGVKVTAGFYAEPAGYFGGRNNYKKLT